MAGKQPSVTRKQSSTAAAYGEIWMRTRKGFTLTGMDGAPSPVLSSSFESSGFFSLSSAPWLPTSPRWCW